MDVSFQKGKLPSCRQLGIMRLVVEVRTNFWRVRTQFFLSCKCAFMSSLWKPLETPSGNNAPGIRLLLFFCCCKIGALQRRVERSRVDRHATSYTEFYTVFTCKCR